MYQALYRKWRPMVFSDVVGQRHITDTLKKQLENGRLSHAYLFTGSHGTGKTTCAKLLAKAVNCEDLIKGEPCNRCPSCVGINSGQITDVSEIDAATYTGVDNIRQIREETSYYPSEVRKRVYIIDECHMLSAGASNAILKILEEPPEHILFILATTEFHRVLPTILSRCQSFAFKPISIDEISRNIRMIASAEKMDLTEEAADLIARFAEGGMRDAISMLDQCAASAQGSIDPDHVLEVLNHAGNYEILLLAELIAAQDTSAVLEKFDTLVKNGKDPSAMMNELVSFFRDLLVYKITGDRSLVHGSRETEDLKRIDIPHTRLLVAIDTIMGSMKQSRGSSNNKLNAEMCLIRLCDVAILQGFEGLLARVETLERAVKSGVVVQKAGEADDLYRNSGASPSETAEINGSLTTEKTGESKVKDDKAKDDDEKSVGEAEVTDDGRITCWPELKAAIRPHVGPGLFPHLAHINPPILRDARLFVVVKEFAEDLLKKGNVADIISREAGVLLGQEVRAEIVSEGKLASKMGSSRTGVKKAPTEDKLDILAERFSGFDNTIVE